MDQWKLVLVNISYLYCRNTFHQTTNSENLLTKITSKSVTPAYQTLKQKSTASAVKILNENPQGNEIKCYCTRKVKCSIHGKYLLNNILYIVTLTSSNKYYESTIIFIFRDFLMFYQILLSPQNSRLLLKKTVYTSCRTT